ncbi:MAG: trigger factor [Microlunatus sp.]|nr:trigger factor [Microlunatus sp.]MDN5804564.1 trigger factor [Microlunatus sp.]
MPSNVDRLSPTRVKLTVEVSFDDLKPSMDKAYREIAKSVNIPGFRKGKVPPMVIDQRFGRGTILQEALNDALPKLYGEAVAENSLNPLAQPEVEVTKLEDGESIEFTAEVDVRPDFELPDFSTLSATVDPLDVPAEQIDAQVEGLRQRFGSRSVVERAAEVGDVVTIDLVATKDGESLADATAEGLDYEIGTGGMLDGLDEAATGLSAGESADFVSTLVGGPQKGAEADIHLTVTKVAEQELPDLNDEFAQTASEFDTLEEMRADLAAQLTNAARLEQAASARDAVLENLLAQLEIDLPRNVIDGEIEARKTQIQSQLDGAGIDLDDYLADSGEADDAESFWNGVEKRSADAMKAQLVLDKTAEQVGVTVDQEDLTAYIFRRAQQENTAPQEVIAHMQEHPHHIDEYMLEIRRSKALAAIVEAATVTDSNGDVLELARIQSDGSLADPAPDTGAADTGAAEADDSDNEINEDSSRPNDQD